MSANRVDVRAGLLSKGHVWAIITGVCLEMDQIKNENELWRKAEIVTTDFTDYTDFGEG